MFQKQPNSSSSSSTIIARGVTLEGNFKGDGDVVVEGCVKGSLQTGGMLTVGPEATIEAEVQVGEASVAGTIQGNITVKNRLELRSTAKVTGDVVAQVLAMEAGACLQGRLVIGKGSPGDAKQPARAERVAHAGT
jgi:cytoskeletal protein CcmA (bactofilin family)